VQNADIAALFDDGTLNAGFIAVRPSPLSQQLYRMVREITEKEKTDDQTALNEAVKTMKNKAVTVMKSRAVRRMRKRRNHGRSQFINGLDYFERSERKQTLRVNFLDRELFLNGLDYFEKSDKMFPISFKRRIISNMSTRPLVVHNNYIVGKEAKIYRFREHLMWLCDGVDQYYSSDTRKYLAYENPNPTTLSVNLTRKKVTERELSALKTALTIGHLLNRVVILPKFHCLSRYGYRYQQCPLNAFIDIHTFDFIFSGHYRESSFLQNPKVPNSVKVDRVDRPFILNANQTSDVLVSGTDIMSLFGKLEAKVLNLINLQLVKIDADDGSVDGEFSNKLQSAFRSSDYRQLRDVKALKIADDRKSRRALQARPTSHRRSNGKRSSGS